MRSWQGWARHNPLLQVKACCDQARTCGGAQTYVKHRITLYPIALTWMHAYGGAQTHSPWGAALVKGMMCNWLVCLGVWQATAAQDIIGKIVGIYCARPFPLHAAPLPRAQAMPALNMTAQCLASCRCAHLHLNICILCLLKTV